MEELEERKHPRLKGYDYSNNGKYFLTLCAKDRRSIFGKIGPVGRGIPDAPFPGTETEPEIDPVGRGILDAPFVQLSEYGKNVINAIEFINKQNDKPHIDKYVIMPNHVHLIVTVNFENGASGKPRPTNAAIPKIISSIKRFTNKQAGFEIWQTSYHDHIIRNEADYRRIWQYIDENPAKWEEDKYYI